MTSYPKVSFEHFPRGKEDPTPHRAHIICDASDHHGIGKTPSEALLNAAMHWAGYENSKTPAA